MGTFFWFCFLGLLSSSSWNILGSSSILLSLWCFVCLYVVCSFGSTYFFASGATAKDTEDTSKSQASRVLAPHRAGHHEAIQHVQEVFQRGSWLFALRSRDARSKAWNASERALAADWEFCCLFFCWCVCLFAANLVSYDLCTWQTDKRIWAPVCRGFIQIGLRKEMETWWTNNEEKKSGKHLVWLGLVQTIRL